MRLLMNQPAANPIELSRIQPTQSEPPRAGREELEKLVLEISLRWSSLVRSNMSLVDLLEDPKLPLPKGRKRKLYVNTLPTSSESLASIKARLGHENPSGELDNVVIRALPSKRSFPNLADHGTLYLPYPYVVPGGRFQEMYAWDSFFIALGLLRDNKVRLARNMLDNYIYQIEHYGTILNGNRTYYLTRSQLPFLTPLIKLVLPTVAPSARQAWLRKALSAAEKYHHYWTSNSHLTHCTGLSRFFDYGTPGSAPPELVHETDPRDGSTAHDRVKRFFRKHYHSGIPDYDISKYYNYETDELTAKFMDNDRAMRESGFDTSNRFGPFNSRILDFNPVCLNSLLYLMEKEIGELYEKLEPWKRMSQEGLIQRRSEWTNRAIERRELVQRYNWDETHGLYFDYDFINKARREYVFGTTFLPLWTGLADPRQARSVAEQAVKQLEISGGLSTSATVAGDQWDKPYIWAPLQLFAVDGLRKYGFDIVADRLAANFASMVLKTWRSSGQLWEKYDGVKRDQSVDLKFGYPTNETGFGWTNALFTHFYDHLKAVGKLDDILLLDGLPLPDQDQHHAVELQNKAGLSVEDDEDAEWVEIGIDVPRSP